MGNPGKVEDASRDRTIVVGGAQLGPIQKADSRSDVVRRMISLLDEAKARGCELVVFPELALTTFFPRWNYDHGPDVDQWFEREMPSAETQPLFDRAAEHGVSISFGFAELTPSGEHFNTSILTDDSGAIVSRYRKIHLPGHDKFDPQRSFQHLEKKYFLPGDLGFPVTRTPKGILGMCICNDRRWPETFRVMALQGVEMVVLGYNTPSSNSQNAEEKADHRMFHHLLVLQAAAYQNSIWVVAVAKAGVEDGHGLIGGSVIVNPEGEIVAQTDTEEDELMVHACNLDDTLFGKRSQFDFARHRRIEHYGLITSQTGVIEPPDGG